MNGIGTGKIVTNKTDFTDGKKVVIRVPEGSRALFPDWSFHSNSDDGEQRVMIPPSKLHLVEVREDGTVVLEVGEQMGTEAALRHAVDQLTPLEGEGDRIYAEGLRKKVDSIVSKRIEKRHQQGMFDPEGRPTIDDDRMSDAASAAEDAAGFGPPTPPAPPTPPNRPPTPPNRPPTPPGNGSSPRVPSGEPLTPQNIIFPEPKPRPAPERPKNRPSYGRERTRSTAAINRVVEAEKRSKRSRGFGYGEATDYSTGGGASQQRKELDRIQEMVDGTEYTNYTRPAARNFVNNYISNEFGKEKLSELNDEQLSQLIDALKKRADEFTGDSNDKRALSQMASSIHDYLDIKNMGPYYTDPYEGGYSAWGYPGLINLDEKYPPILGGGFSSGKRSWGSMPSRNEEIKDILEASNNDGFSEVFGLPQTREQRIGQMHETRAEVLLNLRDFIDNVPGAGEGLGLEKLSIDPAILNFIKNSSDEEIYKAISEAAMSMHNEFDSRPRVRMRQDELDNFVKTGRYGRETSFSSGERKTGSGALRRGIRARAKERAIEMIADKIGMDEDSREVAEMVLDTVSALKYGPEAALAKLAIDLGKRGSRDMAERAVRELLDRGKISEDQAKSILSKMDKFAPDGLPEPLKRGVSAAARAAGEAIDTPENRERLSRAREAASDVAGRAREAVGEGARNMAERGRDKLRRLRERDSAGSLPSATEDVPFGSFDPGDGFDSPFSSGGKPLSRRTDRRVANSELGREKIMEGAKVTRTNFSSGKVDKPKEPKKPARPREPDNGPMTGKFIDIFRGSKSYKEMLDRYNQQEVIFFDYETTGLDVKLEKPVQIGAVKMKGGKVVERFNIFVNPGKELSDWSKENLVDADGKPLTDEWLSKQPSIKEAHEKLIAFFGKDAMLGGQYTPFDLGFLEQSLKDSGIEWKPSGVMDSKALADELLPKWTPETEDGPFAVKPDGTKYASNSLGPLAEYLGVDLAAWHTADADSLASAMIVQKILERAAERDDTPRHVLDVDNIPNIVTERRAKHKLAMDKYEEDMKKYESEMEVFNSANAGEKLSSGKTSSGDKPKNPIDDSREEQKLGSGSRAEQRSPGLKANRDRPMSEYGMDWKPEYSEKEWVHPAKDWDGWDNVPLTEVDLSSEIRPTESHLKGSSIDKVVSGEEPFREGYHPHLIIDTDGKMYVSDGHNRVAMHRALGNEKITARVVDLRKQKAPWENESSSIKLSSGGRKAKPVRVKKYKGYDLKEPDNPIPEPGEYPKDVVEAATAHRAEIEKVEKEITKLLIDLADKHKGKMEGLDFRLKSLKSLMRKIAAEKDSEHGGDAEKAAKAMSDVVRYTMSYEPADYVKGVKSVIEEMHKAGYDLRIKNYWKSGDPYQGINVAVTHPDGTKFELQFHTPQSVVEKEKIHAHYEDYRTTTDLRRRYELYDRMVRLAEKIHVPYPPDELLGIGVVKEQPFTRA
jgi:DNA polymerase III epsilon subunit-like protein